MKRMRRFVLPLLCLVLTVVALLGLSSCGGKCDHKWEEGVTVNAGCTYKGAVAYTCKECGEIKTELTSPLGHSFTNYVDDNNATCETEGTKTAVCDNGCGATDTKSVDKRHVYSAEWKSDSDNHWHECTVCGETDAKTAHTPDASGENCTACAYKLHVHTPVEVPTVSATCTTPGVAAHWYCEVCDTCFTSEACTEVAENITIAALGHNATHVDAKAATCTAAGNVEYWYCSNCAKYYSDADCTTAIADADRIIPVTAHSYENVWTSDGTGHWYKCSACDDKSAFAAHTSSGAATETANEYCTVCSYVITPSLGHTHNTTKVDAKAATCTEDGNIAYWYCSSCGKNYSDEACTVAVDSVVVSKTGHSAEYIAATDATCLTDGYLAHYYCDACDKYFSDEACTAEIAYSSIVKSAKHTAVKWVAGKAASCTKDGSVAYYNCEKCGRYYSDSACTIEIALANTVITKLGHNPVYIAATAPSCTSKGNLEYWSCSNCKKLFTTVDCSTETTLATVTLDKTPHDIDLTNPEQTIEATCKEGGYSIFECTDGCGYTVKNLFTPIGDCSEEEVTEAYVAPTCLATGSKTYKCTVCEAERVEILAKTAHSYDESDNKVVAPTCTEEGYTEHYCKTEGCGYSYRDTITQPTDHDLKTETTGATCTVDGSVVVTCNNGGCEYRTEETLTALGHDTEETCVAEDRCSRCDYVAPATGHTYKTVELKDATCSVDGYEKLECHCGSVIMNVPADRKATGHKAADDAVWEEKVVKKDGECVYYTERTTECKYCDEAIVAKGEEYTEHKYVSSITRTATCTTPGVKTYTCSVCVDGEASYTENYDDPEAHAWGDGTTENGVTTYVCAHNSEHTKTSVSAKDEKEATADAETIKNSDDVELKNATFVPDDSIKENLSGEVKFSAEEKTAAELGLDPTLADRIGDSFVYDLQLSIDGAPQTNLNGTMTVKIPYVLDVGEDPDDVIIWYVSGDEPTFIKATFVAETENQDGTISGYAVFETEHFSYYTVTKLQPAERCAVYGHNWKHVNVPATCLTDGYVMHVCSRCAKSVLDTAETYHTNEFGGCYIDGCVAEYPEAPTTALGHDFVIEEETHIRLSCTQDGYEKYACSRCGVSYEVKTTRTGHSWIKNTDESVAPTCSSAGKDVEYCGYDCGATKETYKAPLAHAFSTVVIAPTCTEAGYTEKTCRVCDYVEKTNVKEAIGHSIENTVVAPTCLDDGYTARHCKHCDKDFEPINPVKSEGKHIYDREAPDCEHDKLCTYCGHRDGKRTGHEWTDLGVCKHEGCKAKCAHEWKYVESKAATCTKRAHDVEQCEICCATREVNYTGKTAEHTISHGICTSCGISSGNHYLSMVQTWKNTNGFALKISDLAVDVSDYVEKESAWYVSVKAAQLNVAELMLYTDGNGNLAGAATGTLKVVEGSSTYIYGVNAVIESGVIYLEIFEEIGTYGAKSTQHMTASIDYLIASMCNEALGVDVETAEALIGWIDEYVAPVIDNYVETNADELNATVESLVNMFFVETSTDDGFVYTFNYDKLRELNADLDALTISEFIDKYFGGGAYDALVADILTILDTEIADVPTLLDSLGFSSELITEAVNAFAEMSGKKDFDLAKLLASKDYAGVTVGDFAFGEDVDYKKQVTEISEMLKSVSLYSVIEGVLGNFMNAESLAKLDIAETVNDGIELLEKYLYLAYETSIDGDITNITVKITDLEVIVDEEKTDISLNIELAPGGRVNVNFDSMITEINEKVSFPDMGSFERHEILTGYLDNSGRYIYNDTEYAVYMAYETKFTHRVTNLTNPIATTIYLQCGDSYYANAVYEDKASVAEFEFYVLASNGSTLMLLINTESEEVIEITNVQDVYTCKLPDGTTVTVDAEGEDSDNMFKLLFKAAIPESWYTQSYDYIPTTNAVIYYDAKTGEFELCEEMEQLHSYVIDNDKCVITDVCEESSYYHYVCSKCGEAMGEYDYNHHNERYTYRLSEGSVTCEDGLDWYSYCTVCDKITYVNENDVSEHIEVNTYVWNENAKTLTSEKSCPCGKNHSSEIAFKLNTELDLEYVDMSRLGNYGNCTFEFTPDEGAVYEFWSNTMALRIQLYDSEGKRLSQYGASGNIGGAVIDKPSSGIIGGSIGEIIIVSSSNSAYELTAGETYYVAIEAYSYDSDSTTLLNANIRKSEEISLEEYGCTCGGTLTLTDKFGWKTVTVSCDGKCGFNHYIEEGVAITHDGDCAMYEAIVLYYETEDGTEAVTLHERYSGNYNHSYSREAYKYNYSDAIGTNGNIWRTETYTYTSYCSECGEAYRKRVETKVFDKTTNDTISQEQTYYDWSGETKALEINSYQCREYVYVTYTNGNTEIKTAKEINKYYRHGELSSGWENSYVYYPASHCTVTVTETNLINGVSYTETIAQHAYAQKRVTSECKDYVDANGVKIVIESEETYCSECYASISKNIQKTAVSATGRSYTVEHYEPYAVSADVYGYRLDRVESEEYGFVTVNGETYEYILSNYWADYEEGSLSNWHKYDYNYENGDYCRGTIWVSFSYDPMGHEQGSFESHINMITRFELSEGAESCLDGIKEYRICNVCGDKEYTGYVENSHSTSHWSTEGVVYDLSGCGNACGSKITVYYCPCGERFSIDTSFDECDMREQDFDYTYSENGTESWKYYYACAVTDPNPCGYTYTYEWGCRRGANCRRIYYEIYTFSNANGDPLVFETSYATDEYYHSTTTDTAVKNPYTDPETGYEVRVTENRTYCELCFVTTQLNEDIQYYDANGVEVKYAEKYSYYNNGGTLQRTELHEYTRIYTTDGKHSEFFETLYKESSYNSEGNEYYWRQVEYDRTANCPYQPITTTTDSEYDGSDVQYGDHERWNIQYGDYITESTCTQYGERERYCAWCSFTTTEAVYPHGHDFRWNGETNVCYYCGLESESGYDGSVSLEDLTSRRGGGVNYVIGVRFMEYFDYSVYVYGTNADGEMVILSVIPGEKLESDTRLIYVSIEELKASAIEEGLSICENEISFAIVPNGSSDFEYAITLDPHVCNISSSYTLEDGNTVFTHTYSCIVCDKTVKTEECRFEYYWSDNGETAVCVFCGQSVRKDRSTSKDETAA